MAKWICVAVIGTVCGLCSWLLRNLIAAVFKIRFKQYHALVDSWASDWAWSTWYRYPLYHLQPPYTTHSAANLVCIIHKYAITYTLPVYSHSLCTLTVLVLRISHFALQCAGCCNLVVAGGISRAQGRLWRCPRRDGLD